MALLLLTLTLIAVLGVFRATLIHLRGLQAGWDGAAVQAVLRNAPALARDQGEPQGELELEEGRCRYALARDAGVMIEAVRLELRFPDRDRWPRRRALWLDLDGNPLYLHDYEED